MGIAEDQEKNYAVPELLRAQQFRERLREAIEWSGVPQRKLAKGLKIRPATVTDWLTSEGLANLPSGEVLLRLTGMLRVNHHWLWTGDGDPRAAPGDADVLLKEMRRWVEDPRGVAAEILARPIQPGGAPVPPPISSDLPGPATGTELD